MATPTEQLKDLGLDTLVNIWSNIVGVINEILNGIAPNFSVQLVFLISVMIGAVLKKNYKQDWTFMIITSLLIFFSLRFLQIGG